MFPLITDFELLNVKPSIVSAVTVAVVSVVPLNALSVIS